MNDEPRSPEVWPIFQENKTSKHEDRLTAVTLGRSSFSDPPPTSACQWQQRSLASRLRGVSSCCCCFPGLIAFWSWVKSFYSFW